MHCCLSLRMSAQLSEVTAAPVALGLGTAGTNLLFKKKVSFEAVAVWRGSGSHENDQVSQSS